MDELFLFGRVIFGGYFVYNGVNHFINTAVLAQFAAAKGVPMPELSVMLAGALMLAGGLSILFGLWPHLGSLCIALFLLVVTPAMHNFWAATDAQQRLADMMNFMKNGALLGSTLMLYGVPTPWAYSLESRHPVVS
jgi:putative oxidoreductase